MVLLFGADVAKTTGSLSIFLRAEIREEMINTTLEIGEKKEACSPKRSIVIVTILYRIKIK